MRLRFSASVLLSKTNSGFLTGIGFISSLKISDNYYDDIDAKFGLETSILEKIKKNNILYDEDNEGCFFQIYTTLINNSFFFEFVQRNQSYEGYGANNAIFRISAQKKLIHGSHTW